MVAEPVGLLLAAGGSGRLGRSKQLLQVDSETLVRRQAGTLLRVVSRIVAVVGADAPAVAKQLDNDAIVVVENAQWRQGMGGSLALGVRRLPGNAAGVLVLLCDQYRIEARDLKRLLEAWRACPDRAVVSRWGETSGPPVIFPRAWFTELAGLKGDEGARRIVNDRSGQVQFVELENAAYDLDTPSDLAGLDQGS